MKYARVVATEVYHWTPTEFVASILSQGLQRGCVCRHPGDYSGDMAFDDRNVLPHTCLRVRVPEHWELPWHIRPFPEGPKRSFDWQCWIHEPVPPEYLSVMTQEEVDAVPEPPDRKMNQRQRQVRNRARRQRQAQDRLYYRTKYKGPWWFNGEENLSPSDEDA